MILINGMCVLCIFLIYFFVSVIAIVIPNPSKQRRMALFFVSIVWRCFGILDFRQILIEIDSKSALSLARSHPHASLVALIQEPLSRQWSIKLTHVYRQANKAADRLAILRHTLALGVTFCRSTNKTPLCLLESWYYQEGCFCFVSFFFFFWVIRSDAFGVAYPRMIFRAAVFWAFTPHTQQKREEWW